MSKKPQPSTVTAQNQLVKWINDAGMSDGPKKASLLRKINEVLLHQLPDMIPVYMENVLSNVTDKFTDVKKQVISFIEEISKSHPKYLPKVVSHLQLLVIDSVVAVQKRAIQAASIVYKNILLWMCDPDNEFIEMQHVWEHLTKLKLLILNMIDSENEGIRTHSIKFLEIVVLLQSTGEDSGDEFSLDNLPKDFPFLKRKSLEEEAEHIFSLLLKFHNSQMISSVNLMACMTTLCLIGKFRPKYLPRVVQALGDLHTTLPPTLSQSQVNSVRKHLKMQLLNLVKRPTSYDMMPQLTQLLLDIGMTPQEINKALPKERRNKRLGEIKNGDAPAKRIRVDSPIVNSDSNSNSRSDFNLFDDENSQQEATSKSIPTEDSVFEGLNNVDLVTNLVMATLRNNLPETMPDNFAEVYKPISNAGTVMQKRSLAKMMMTLIKEDITPAQTSAKSAGIPLLKDDDEKITLKNAVAKLQESSKAERQVENAISKLMEETRQAHLKEDEKKSKEKEKPPPTPTIPKLKQKVKLLKLQEITRPIPKEIKEKLMLQSINRILKAEKDAAIGGAAQIRSKLISMFASSYTPEIRELVLNYILEDPLNRIDLALSWLYEEYAIMQGFNRLPVTLHPKANEKHSQNYNQLFCALITQICESGDPVMEASKDILIRRVYTEAPVVTEEAVEYLKHLINEDKSPVVALELLEELCIMRPPRAHKYVSSLACNVLHENEEIRDLAITLTVKIYKCSMDTVKKVIEKHALVYLGFIALTSPPSEVCTRHSRQWTNDMYKICLNLVFALLPENPDLICEVGRVYGLAGAEAKRCVLRVAEAPLRGLLPPGAPLLPAIETLLDMCPRGSETLLTRIIHILTENAPASPELVERVRELYSTSVSDVRFLIPVINKLSKREILAALPKLIKLNPQVVKEVFNKLLGLHNPHNEDLPLSPEDLLVELHLIDPNKADLKYIIKATAVCFAEKRIYTQDVLSAVLQRLASEPEIPVLMMRSVLQALTLHPALAPLALNVLQLLVDKEVWTNKVAWEGWVKVCERLGARAAAALAMLPPLARDLLPTHLRAQEYPPVPPPGSTPHEPLPPGMD
ncbi:symplekin isoform X2 [Aricia agestis]|uniref:symplekin isoform X2 n=1 Tax=Aricia agestis TaxID=91739 RepID=UPI001C203D30|nr:symplekin isoform X2 [Aricia agestis]